MERSRELISRGMKEGSRWRLAIGVGLGLLGLARRATRPEAEVVNRVVLRPGDRIVIETRDPEPKAKRRRRKRG